LCVLLRDETMQYVVRLVVATGLVAVAAGCGGDGSIDLASGDPEAGKQVFAMQGCVHCHTFAAAGSIRNAGPNLDEVADRYPAEFILESIMDPGAYIEKGSGGTIGGTKEYRVPMPPSGPNAPNAENVITEQELADLVAFIDSGGGP
jgi:mono/diheme cytochrome c family protein